MDTYYENQLTQNKTKIITKSLKLKVFERLNAYQNQTECDGEISINNYILNTQCFTLTSE